MVLVRELRRAYQGWHGVCFWSSPANYRPGLQDRDWIVEGLRRHGGRQGWQLAETLCR
jgi:hypothetical protein